MQVIACNFVGLIITATHQRETTYRYTLEPEWEDKLIGNQGCLFHAFLVRKILDQHYELRGCWNTRQAAFNGREFDRKGLKPSLFVLFDKARDRGVVRIK